MVYFNCEETSHISTQFQKPKMNQNLKAGGKIFSLRGAEASNYDNLVRGICFTNDFPLNTIVDTGVAHSFISADYVKRLNLVAFSMNGNMVIDTLANGSVTTSLVCLNCLLEIYGRDFGIDCLLTVKST